MPMLFKERATSPGFAYTVEDLFGTITIQSAKKLDGPTLDRIVMAVLKTGATEGTVTDDITFTFAINNTWQEDEEPVPST